MPSIEDVVDVLPGCFLAILLGLLVTAGTIAFYYLMLGPGR